MKKMLALGLLSVILLGNDFAASVPAPLAAEAKAPRLAHSVFFALKDNSEAAKETLLAACQGLFAGNPDITFFATGGPAHDLQRPVNDRDFDVSVLVVFKDKVAHDRFQENQRHLKLIEEHKGNWKKVRVFDSYLNP